MVKPPDLEGFYGLIVAVIAEHDAFFEGEQITGVGPLLAGIKWEFVVPGVDESYFFRAFKVVLADIGQQVFEILEVFGVGGVFFPELDDLELVFLLVVVEDALDVILIITPGRFV